jgi:hypothetical protein
MGIAWLAVLAPATFLTNVLVASKLDGLKGVVDWYWRDIFFPVWIVDAIFLVHLITEAARWIAQTSPRRFQDGADTETATGAPSITKGALVGLFVFYLIQLGTHVTITGSLDSGLDIGWVAAAFSLGFVQLFCFFCYEASCGSFAMRHSRRVFAGKPPKKSSVRRKVDKREPPISDPGYPSSYLTPDIGLAPPSFDDIEDDVAESVRESQDGEEVSVPIHVLDDETASYQRARQFASDAVSSIHVSITGVITCQAFLICTRWGITSPTLVLSFAAGIIMACAFFFLVHDSENRVTLSSLQRICVGLVGLTGTASCFFLIIATGWEGDGAPLGTKYVYNLCFIPLYVVEMIGFVYAVMDIRSRSIEQRTQEPPDA